MARSINTDIKSYDSRKIYTYNKNGRNTSTKDVKRTAIYWNDEIGSHHYETVDVDFKDIPVSTPITNFFKITLCVILTSLFLFGTYNVERGVYFGDYENYNTFDTSDYLLDNGKTIKQVYNNYDLDINYLSNDYDWFNKFDTLSRLRNPVSYDFLNVKIKYNTWNDKDKMPTPKDLNVFENITNYRELGVVISKLSSDKYKFVFDYSYNYWQIVRSDTETEPADAITFNNKIVSTGSVAWYDYIQPIMMLPINIITNIIYDVVVVVDFVKNW